MAERFERLREYVRTCPDWWQLCELERDLDEIELELVWITQLAIWPEVEVNDG